MIYLGVGAFAMRTGHHQLEGVHWAPAAPLYLQSLIREPLETTSHSNNVSEVGWHSDELYRIFITC